MKKMSLQFLKACSLTVALLGSAAIVTAISLPDAAFAKSGNDNGGGNGNGNGNGGNSDKSNGNGKSDKAEKSEKAGKSDKADKNKADKNKADKNKSDKKKSGGESATSTAMEKTKAKAKPKKKDLAEELGVHPSELGALNAAHANENALKNASPNSRVGRIAAYRDAVVAGEALADELASKEAELAALTPPGRESDLVKTDLDLAVTATDTAAGIVTDLETELATTDPTDAAAVAAILAELATARGTLTAAEAAEALLLSEYNNAVAYETVEAEVDDLNLKVADQPELERSLLEAAANKEVTDEVEAAVRKLLGL